MEQIKNMFDNILKDIGCKDKKEAVELKIRQNRTRQKYIENTLNDILATKEKGLWQIDSKDNNKIIFKNDFEKSKWRLINLETKEVSEAIYNICHVINNIAIVETIDKYCENRYDNKIYGIIKLKDQEIINFNYKNLIVLDEKIDFKYSKCNFCPEENFIVVQDKETNIYSVINTENKKIIPLMYDCCYDFSEDLAIVVKNEKYGFINTKGEEVIPCIYDDCDNFSEGFAAVLKDGKWGFINKKGEEICKIKYDYCWKFNNGLANVEKSGKCGFINTKGKEICIGYDDSYFLTNGLIKVEKNNKYGFINTEGKKVIPCIYDYCSNFSEGLTKIFKDNKYGFINTKGEEVISCIYDYCDNFSEGLAVISKDGKYGFINKTGQEIIPCVYDSCDDFTNGFAPMSKTNKFGFINKIGDEYWFNENDCFKKVGSRNSDLYYKKYKDTFVVETGCFIGTLKDFENRVIKTHKNNEFAKTYFEIINFLRENLK